MSEQRLREALTELVALRDAKAQGKLATYYAGIDAAFDKARAALAAPIAAPADEARDAARWQYVLATAPGAIAAIAWMNKAACAFSDPTDAVDAAMATPAGSP